MGYQQKTPECIGIASTVGERMRAARQALGLNQLNAAAQFGYANSSKLAKIEFGRADGGQGCRHVSLWVIKRASCLYDVSVDYLFGLRDNPAGLDLIEAQELDDVCHDLIRNEERREAEASELIALAAELQLASSLAKGIVSAAVRVDQAIDLAERQEAWQDARGGARLASACERLAATTRAAEQYIYRAKPADRQLKLELRNTP